MRNYLLTLFILITGWSGAGNVRAAVAGSVVAWGGNNYDGQTTVPFAAQNGVTAIAAGNSHTAALKNDGSVVAWGAVTTVPAEAQSGVMAIAAGERHLVALKNDGSVVAWGNNFNGQTQVPVPAQSGVTAIAAGGSHTVALKNDGSVVAWGYSGYGATTVPVEAESGVIAIAAGRFHVVALKSDGSVVAWGDNEYGQTTVPAGAQTNVTAISAGDRFTAALKDDGGVIAWGYGSEANVPLAAQSGVIAIAAGGFQIAALKHDGSVVVWGVSGDLSDVPGIAQSGVTAIAVGEDHIVALVAPIAPSILTQPPSQTVEAWQSATFAVVAEGYPLNYQWRKNGLDLLGATEATFTLPLAPPGSASYTVVVSNHVGSVTSSPPAVLTVNPAAPGLVVAWGYNNYGQTTVPVSARSGVVAITAGAEHTVAVKNDGSVVAWGYEYDGRIVVPLAAQSEVSAIAAGYSHTVALKNDGSVVAWGANEYGQTIVPVSAQSGVTAIAAGDRHTVALKTDGSVIAWGDNDDGQTTVLVSAQSGVTAIAAGGRHTVALKSDGSVVAWGYNGYGQTTVPVAAQSGVIAIAAGGNHTVALKTDGSVIAWGDSNDGQTTVPASAQSGVTSVAAGYSYTVALKSDGTVVVWGGQATVPEGLGGVAVIAAGVAHTVVILGTIPPAAPSITTQPSPASLTVSVGQSASFAVVAAGHPLSYQWWRDGAPLLGETRASFSRPFPQSDAAGPYTVVVSNYLGSVTSNPVMLTVDTNSPGCVVVWGDDDDVKAVPLAAQTGVVAIAAGDSHVLALKNDHSVIAWGYNGYGQTDVPLAAQSGVISVAAGHYHSVALKDDGSVVAWGDNRDGQCDVPVAAQTGVTAIAAGDDHTVALKTDGSVLAWGDNDKGQTTVPVAAQSGVVAISAGYDHTLALKDNGAVIAWGAGNSFFNVGQTAVPPSAQSGVSAIAAGSFHSLALKSNGTVVAWGRYREDFPDDFFTIHIPVPETLAGVIMVASDEFQSLALRNDGTVAAWGNDTAQVLDVPFGLAGVKAIAAGEEFSVALVGIITPEAPTIVAQPASHTVTEGDDAVLAVFAAGYPLIHQWRKDGIVLVGATNAVYSLPFVLTNQAGSYTVVVSNYLGSIMSSPAVLTVLPAPALNEALDAPGLVWTSGGSSGLWRGQFSVTHDGLDAARSNTNHHNDESWMETTVMGPGVLSYWWKVSSEPWCDYLECYVDGILQPDSISGEVDWIAHTATIDSVGPVVVRFLYVNDSYGYEGQNRGWVDQVSYISTVASPPVITSQPADVSVVAGDTVTLSVEAVSTTPIFYQWRRDGTNLSDANTASYEIINADQGDAGPYTVVLTNGFGSVTSEVAVVTVLLPIPIGEAVDAPELIWISGGSIGQWKGQTNFTYDGLDAARSAPLFDGQNSWMETTVAGPGALTFWWKVSSEGSYDFLRFYINEIPSGEISGDVDWNQISFPDLADGVHTLRWDYTKDGSVSTGLDAGFVDLVHFTSSRPILSVASSGAELIFSWPESASGFTLQAATNLAPPVTWMDVTNVPVARGGQLTITNVISTGAQFFRLAKP